jgi:hypothetical protein
MNEITTTTASDRSRGRLSRRLRRLVVGVAALVLGAGAAVGPFASAANADVNLQYPWTYSTWTFGNCRIWTGDQASPQMYAIGDTTVQCSSYHNIAVYTKLYRNGVLVATSANPYSYFPNTWYVHDVPTAPIHCGGSASWYTLSWVSIDGSAWYSKPSPTAPFTPSADSTCPTG